MTEREPQTLVSLLFVSHPSFGCTQLSLSKNVEDEFDLDVAYGHLLICQKYRVIHAFEVDTLSDSSRKTGFRFDLVTPWENCSLMRLYLLSEIPNSLMNAFLHTCLPTIIRLVNVLPLIFSSLVVII